MRAFIAVDAASNRLAGLQQEILSVSGWKAAVKPVEAQNFHFTLLFLGEINPQQAESIKTSLSELKFEPFSIKYQEIGAFPKPDFARVVWVGVDPEGGRKLVALAQQIISLLRPFGFAPDKPFSPHLTLFRAKRGPISLGSLASRFHGIDLGSDFISEVHLKKSDLSLSGPTYSNIYTVRAVTV